MKRLSIPGLVSAHIRLRWPKWARMFLTTGIALSLALGGAATAAAEQLSPVQLVHESREALGAGNLDKAHERAQAAVAADPAYADGWKQLGRTQMLRGDHAGALASFRTALDLIPDDPQIRVWMLDVVAGLDDPAALMKALDAATDATIRQRGAQWHADLVYRLLEKGYGDEATRMAARWARVSPGDPTRHAANAIRQLTAGDLGAAERSLLAAPAPGDAAPLIAAGWARLGRLRAAAGQHAGAVAAFEQALRLRPLWQPALRDLGWAQHALGQPARAADTWTSGLPKTAQPNVWLLWIAEARFAANQHDAALGALEQLLAAEPEHERARILKLAVLIKQGKAPAVAEYEGRLRSAADSRWIIALGHATAERALGKHAEAARRLEELAGAEAGNEKLRALLIDAYADWARTVSGAQAIAPLEKLTALAPDRLTAWRDLGWSYWAAGRRDDALSAWDRVIRGELPGREKLVTQIVGQLAEEGKGDEALALFRRWQLDTGLLPTGIELVKAGRYQAAHPLLDATWRAGQQPLISGLYLAVAEAHMGQCVQVRAHLTPALETLATLPSERVELVLAALIPCSSDPTLVPLFDKVVAEIGDKPQHAAKLADLLRASAAEYELLGERARAFDLYRDSLRRQPDQPGVWLRAAQLGDELGRTQEVDALLAALLASARSAAVKEGVRGYQAMRAGDSERGVKFYRASLAQDATQAELRLLLVLQLIALERYEDARREAEWFITRSNAGDTGLSSHVAEIRRAFGETPEALQQWEALYLGYPEKAYYGVEAARTQFLTCHADRATKILDDVIATRPDPRAYELLAEIATAQGQTREALRWATEGLKHAQTRGLLRLQAEAAESLGDMPVAQQAAASLLALDPGNVPIARLYGRALSAQGDLQGANAHYQALLARNPQFLPALVSLKDVASDSGEPDAALRYAQAAAEQRPWDAAAGRRLAVTQAEAARFRPALVALREQAGVGAEQVVAVLIYDDVTSCQYPGRTTAAQVATHVRRLAAEDIRLVGPDQFDAHTLGARALLIVANADAAALRQMDEALARSGGRAVYAASGRELAGGASGKQLAELAATGRWVIGSTGPVDSRRVPVDARGTLGNPLTHRVHAYAGVEEPAQAAARVDAALARAVARVPQNAPRLLVYPAGDYGQYSLDTDAQTIAQLRDATGRHFAFAVAGDDAGFVTPGFDPLRLPARVVPPAWDENTLVDHLRRQHPVVQTRLQLAKVLLWQGQHEAANVGFAAAEKAGAEPAEVYFHWGNNAHREGDLPTALEKLRRAHALDPEAARVTNALEAVELRKHPLLSLDGEDWSDSDSRRYRRWGAEVSGHVSDALSLGLFADTHNWKRDGLGEEQGERLGAGLQWYFAPGHWLEARAWRMNLDSIDDHTGGSLNLRLPLPSWGGSLNLQAGRAQVDTVEAVRAGILADDIVARLHSRLYDVWDLYTDLGYTSRSDGNDTWLLDGRLVARIKEWPFVGAGYRFRFGDSDRDPPEYWAPERLSQHQLYLGLRGDLGPFKYNLSGEAGYSKERDTDWRFVWGGRARLEFLPISRLRLSAEARRLETPTYDQTGILLNLDLRF